MEKYVQPQKTKVPNVAGYPEKDVKTSAIITRGNGAATKGNKARGPMA